MMMQTDFDLNSLQIHTEPLEDVIKQTMLKQEFIFRNQVHELHQLYNMQKSLMKVLVKKGFDRCDSFQLPLVYPNTYEVLQVPDETIFTSISHNGSIHCPRHKLLEGHRPPVASSLQRQFDLQLSADEFINNAVNDNLMQRNAYDFFKYPGEELKLSLSTRVDERPRGGIKRTWSAHSNHSDSPDVINLEESDEHGKSKFSPDDSECCQKQRSPSRGTGDLYNNVQCNNMKQFNPYQRQNWDLNQAHSDPMDLSGEDLLSYIDGHKKAIIDLNIELSYEKSEIEDVVIPSTDKSRLAFQDGYDTKSPASCKSYCISDNGSSSGKTEHSCITVDATTPSSKAHVEHQVVEVQKTSDEAKEDSGMANVSAQIAAESLIHMSSEICIDIKAESMVEVKQLPRYPADSFEFMTLNLTESNVDDGCVSSKPFEVNHLEKKGFSSKLRRGRRWKDFQKEVLPAIASLSGPEIREDLSIIEGVLRSREYRKMRAKMVKQQQPHKLSVSVSKSRRSRLNYVRRRNFSFKFN